MADDVNSGRLLEYMQNMQNELLKMIESTKTDLLIHMQGMKNDLQQKINGLQQQITKLDRRISGVDGKISGLEQKMGYGFEQARLHRNALQEDLNVALIKLDTHDKKLARV